MAVAGHPRLAHDQRAEDPVSGQWPGPFPWIDVSPASHYFGSVGVGHESAAHVCTVSNLGTATLHIGQATIIGSDASDFSVTNDHCSGGILNPAESCTLEVIFSPTATGIKNASVSLPSNDSVTPALEMAIAGTAEPAVCPGDCNHDRSVTVDELLMMVNIALGNVDVSTCSAGDVGRDGQVTVDEILIAVYSAVNGCPAG